MRNMDFRRAVVEVARDLEPFVTLVGLALAGFGGVVRWSSGCRPSTVALVGTLARPAVPPDVRGTHHGEAAVPLRLASRGNRVPRPLALNGDYFVVGNRRHDQYASYYQAFLAGVRRPGAQLNGLSAVLFLMYSRRTGGVATGMYKALRIVALFSFPVGGPDCARRP